VPETRITAANSTKSENYDTFRTTRAKIARYGTRFWAVYLNGELLAVTVYKKGAVAVQNALNAARN
jgi:hypothetical protein